MPLSSWSWPRNSSKRGSKSVWRPAFLALFSMIQWQRWVHLALANHTNSGEHLSFLAKAGVWNRKQITKHPGSEFRPLRWCVMVCRPITSAPPDFQERNSFERVLKAPLSFKHAHSGPHLFATLFWVTIKLDSHCCLETQRYPEKMVTWCWEETRSIMAFQRSWSIQTTQKTVIDNPKQNNNIATNNWQFNIRQSHLVKTWPIF